MFLGTDSIVFPVRVVCVCELDPVDQLWVS